MTRTFHADRWWEPRVTPVWPHIESAEAWVRCPECRALMGWSSLAEAGCALVWHVYERHPRAWRAKYGLRPPVDSRPETLSPADELNDDERS